MFRKLLQFEWTLHFKNPTYLIFSILFFLLGIYFSSSEGAIDISNSFNIHLFVSLISLATIIQLMFQASHSLLRDVSSSSIQIINSTAVSKLDFLSSRIIGILSTTTISSLLYVLGMIVYTAIDPVDIHSSSKINVLYFIWPWLLIVVPNIFIAGSLICSAAIIGKKSSWIFLTGIILFGIFWINNLYIGSPFTGGKLVVSIDTMALISLTDPFGLCASFGQAQFWTPLEKANDLLRLSGAMAWNRLIWTSIGGLILLATYTFFSFRMTEQKSMLTSLTNFLKSKSLPFKKERTNKALYAPKLTIKNGLKANVLEFSTLVGVDIKSIIWSRIFVLLLIVWISILFLAISHNINGQEIFGNSQPTTGLIVGLILEPLPYIGFLLIIFYTGELVWKSRQYQFNEILDTTPSMNSILLFSKYVALFLLPCLLILFGIILGILIQYIKGYSAFNLPVYLSLFYYGGMPLFIYAILSLFVHQFVSNKYIGMLASTVLIGLLGYGLPSLGFTHPLFSIFQFPKLGQDYSVFTGFGQHVHIFNWLSLLWATAAGLILILSFRVYNRNTTGSFTERLHTITHNWKMSQRVAFVLLLSTVLISATHIDRQVNLQGVVRTNSDLLDQREFYERNYRSYGSLISPEVIGIKTTVDIYPNDLSFRVKGDYTIKNTSTIPIDSILITSPLPLMSLQIEGASLRHLDATHFDVRLLTLNPALAPGEVRKMEFEVVKKVAGIETIKDIQLNGTYLRNSSFEPRLSYQDGLEIRNLAERQKRDLKNEDDHYNFDQHDFCTPSKQKLSFESIVTTDVDQIAITSGRLIKTTIDGNRKSYHYKANGKSDNTISYISAAYNVYKSEHKGIGIEIFYHPLHDDNIEAIETAAKACLDYCINNFGAYPYGDLKIAEVPSHWHFGGHALMGLVALQERYFTQDPINSNKGINQLSRVVIHEVAHEWFGHKLAPKPGRGGNMLTESMANYIEAQVIERMYGTTMARRMSNFSRRRYFGFRSQSKTTEPPLYLNRGEPYIAYRKGFIAMQSLRELIGESALNNVLKNLIEKHTLTQSATSLDFLDLLESRVTEEEMKLINQWFKQQVTYDMSIDSVDYNTAANGDFTIDIKLNARKFNTTLDGEELQLVMNEKVCIGLYDRHPDDDKASVSYQYISVDKEIKHITITAEKRPMYVVLDPKITRLDENYSDNIVQLH